MHPSGGKRWLGRACLECDKFLVDIQTLPDAHDTLKTLREEGGYGITHVGRVQSKSGKVFSPADAIDCIIYLGNFMSFCRGLWTPVMLPVGFSSDGEKIFEQWSVPIGYPWSEAHRWFDTHHGEALDDLYPGFVKLLRDPVLGNPARKAISWYLWSNRGGSGTGIHSGIILTQAALEHLSVMYLCTINKSPIKKDSAAMKMRRGFQFLKLPLSIPTEMKTVASAFRQGVWSDLPDATAKTRNDIVHPHKKLSVNMSEVIKEIWTLSQRQLELLILRLSGYNGKYGNRCKKPAGGERFSPCHGHEYEYLF